MASPKIAGVIETAIHVENVVRSAAFYESLFGFKKMLGDDRFCAFDVGGRDVFLIFQKGGSTNPISTPGGMIPPHDGSGRMHFAFAISAADWDAWLAKLEAAGIKIESIVNWPAGGRSVYFRDPDDHLVELATPGMWPNY